MPRMMLQGPRPPDADRLRTASDIVRGAAAKLEVTPPPEIDGQGIVDWGPLPVFEVDNALTAAATDWKDYFLWMPS